MALCACFLDEEAKAQLRINRAIERDLDQWKKDNSKEFKLLLLGEFMFDQLCKPSRYLPPLT